MKKNHLATGLAVLTLALSLGACKKSSTSSTPTGTQLAFAVTADNATTPVLNSVNTTGLTTDAAATTNASITFTSAVANIAQFKLEAKKNNKEIEITTKNLTNVNLLAITPAEVSTAIDTGTYKEIEIRIILAKTTTTAIPLTLKGTFTPATGSALPFEFDFNDDAIIKAEAANVTVNGTTDIVSKVNFHLNKLLATVTAAEIANLTLTNGTLLISSTVNTTVYNKIKLALALSFESKGFDNRDKKERKKE